MERVQPTKAECPKGHPYSGDNLGWKEYGNGKAYAYCLTCHRQKQRDNRPARHAKIKREAMQQYGNGRCACCGEHHLSMLTLDHVNDDGQGHRTLIGMIGSGTRFYLWLKKNGWPNDPPLQVLCFNCNQAKHIEGECPHVHT